MSEPIYTSIGFNEAIRNAVDLGAFSPDVNPEFSRGIAALIAMTFVRGEGAVSGAHEAHVESAIREELARQGY